MLAGCSRGISRVYFVIGKDRSGRCWMSWLVGSGVYLLQVDSSFMLDSRRSLLTVHVDVQSGCLLPARMVESSYQVAQANTVIVVNAKLGGQ